MTQIPDYTDGGNSNGNRAGVRPARPTAVTVLATIGMIVGALTVLCSIVSVPPLFMGSGVGAASPNPLTAAVRDEPRLYHWHVFATFARLALGLLLLIGSLAASALREWGRRLMLGYAVLALLVTVTDTVMTVKYMLPIVNRLAATDPNVQAIASKQNVGVPLTVLLGCAYPVLVLIFMTRPRIRAAFARGSQASGGIVPDRAGR